MKTMDALVKAKSAPGLWMEKVPVPEIGINDVLIKIKKTAICGTDVHIYKWNDWARKTIPVPMHVGHEFVGEIVAVGSNVRDFHPGDLVSGEGHVVCGRCRNCLAGRRHLCNKTSGVGVNRPGCFAEYLSLPVTNAWHLHKAADFHQCLHMRARLCGIGQQQHNQMYGFSVDRIEFDTVGRGTQGGGQSRDRCMLPVGYSHTHANAGGRL